MNRADSHHSSIEKHSNGDRVFFAFVGRAARSGTRTGLSAKSLPLHRIFASLLILLVVCMMAVVLWRHAF